MEKTREIIRRNSGKFIAVILCLVIAFSITACAEGADLVYLMAHLGLRSDASPWTYADVVGNTSGLLSLVQTVFCEGDNPCGLTLSLDERFLFVMNRDTEQIVTFSIAEDGKLSDTGRRMPCPLAANLMFVECRE